MQNTVILNIDELEAKKRPVDQINQSFHFYVSCMKQIHFTTFLVCIYTRGNNFLKKNNKSEINITLNYLGR